MPMADPQPSPDQAPSAAPGHQEEAGTQYFHSVLRSLVGMGHDLARHIHAKAIAPDPAPAPAEASAPRQPDVAPDLTIPFDRIAGCIRRTIAQALALDDPRPPPVPTRRPAPVACAPAAESCARPRT